MEKMFEICAFPKVMNFGVSLIDLRAPLGTIPSTLLPQHLQRRGVYHFPRIKPPY